MNEDGEIVGVTEEEPDLSDLAMVIVNVETRDGRQLSIAYGLEAEGDKLSAIVDGGYGENYEEWAFTIRRTTS